VITKKILNHNRRRQKPTLFSWIEHKFVQNGHIYQCTPDASALYLFLLTVADKEGLSYYSDASVSRFTSLNQHRLECARNCLIKANFIAYESPHYQVLMLPKSNQTQGLIPVKNKPVRKRVPNDKGEMVSIGELLRTALKKCPENTND
jgi:hypothetical protein